MGYAVHSRDASGAVSVEDVASLDAALERFEQLRNEDGASDVRVFSEVPIEVRTYYKAVAVESDQPTGQGGSEPPPGAMPLTPPPVHVRATVAAADGDETAEDGVENAVADQDRRSSLFSRG